MPTLLTAGDGTNGAVITSASDNALTIQTGPNGAKVNAIAIASDGTMTLNKPMAGGSLTLATAQNTTSGTSIDFTLIPSWARRITVMFNGVSTNGTSKTMLQIGAGSVLTSGYAGSSSNTATTTGFSAGFVWCENASAADTRSGMVVLTNISGNIWVITGIAGTTQSSATPTTLFGNVTLSGTLDRVRITTVNGTDTFDAGSVNILYEG